MLQPKILQFKILQSKIEMCKQEVLVYVFSFPFFPHYLQVRMGKWEEKISFVKD